MPPRVRQKLVLPMLRAMQRRCGQPEKCEHFDRGTCKCLDNGIKNQRGVFYRLAWDIRDCKIRTTPLMDLMTEEEKVQYHELMGK